MTPPLEPKISPAPVDYKMKQDRNPYVTKRIIELSLLEILPLLDALILEHLGDFSGRQNGIDARHATVPRDDKENEGHTTSVFWRSRPSWRYKASWRQRRCPPS